jgi:imidazolonepropionase-like amidohydrolase
VAPDAPPIENAWVLIDGGRIEAVGDASAPQPAGVPANPACSGGAITAGYQNSHVHLTDVPFAGAAAKPAAELAQALSRMLTRYGFTTVVDTGSIVEDTVAVRERIERGEIDGPAILTRTPSAVSSWRIPQIPREWRLPSRPASISSSIRPSTIRRTVCGRRS